MIFFCSQKNRRSRCSSIQRSTASIILRSAPAARTANAAGNCCCGCSQAVSVTLDAEQVRITGGSSSTAQITVASVTAPTPQNPNLFVINLDQSGDFSTYTLALIAMPSTWQPPENIDPQLSRVSFSFKAGCPTNSDCLPDNCCPPDVIAPPDINYLARDYDSFRQTMLDRLAVLVPGWQGRTSRHRHRAARIHGLCRRPYQLPAGRGRHGSLSANRAQPHLCPPSCQAGRLLSRSTKAPTPARGSTSAPSPMMLSCPKAPLFIRSCRGCRRSFLPLLLLRR